MRGTDRIATFLQRTPSPERCGEMVGASPATRSLFREIRQLSGERCPVLINGETGTGKELAARALHQLGPAGRPWVALNCAAISETLAQSELFGHEKGAFTGAAARHRGAFERADGGILFLDEVGELSLPLQAQLLRVLETGEFYRLGSDRPQRSCFRLLAATHRDLA
ncbi:MAG: sigma-54 factor interaction domain-containing protein, partial [Deltaproteobacteria bacterium]|nr:sigma-54 factor interaction domain-containing protein [Deltaproteobacteria bacterium]